MYTGRNIHIPPGKELELMCKVKAGPQGKTYSAMIVSQAFLRLPKDFLVARVFANVKRGIAPVRVKNLSQHAITIPLVDAKHFRLFVPYRKITPSQWQDVSKLLVKMEAKGIIRPSKGPYALSVVIVIKKTAL